MATTLRNVLYEDDFQINGNYLKESNSIEQNLTAIDAAIKANETAIASAQSASSVTVEKLTTAESGFASSYVVKQNGTQVGATINIPKDQFVQSGEVVTDPEGKPVGTYIKLVLQNVDEPLFIAASDLIEYVTSGSSAGDVVVINVSDDHKVTATITDGTVTKAKLTTAVQNSLAAAERAAEAVISYIAEGPDKTMNKFNG